MDQKAAKFAFTRIQIVLRHNASVGAFDTLTKAICGIAMNSIGKLDPTDEEEEMYNRMSDKLQYLVRVRNKYWEVYSNTVILKHLYTLDKTNL